MDASRLSKGEQIVGGAGIVLFITSFLKLWGKVEVDVQGFSSGSENFNAWDGYGFLVKLGLFLGLIAAVLVAAKLFGADLKFPVGLGLVYTGLGALTTLLMLLGVLAGPDDEGVDKIAGVNVDRGLLLYLAVILGAAITYGGYLHMQSETSAPTPTEPPPPAA